MHGGRQEPSLELQMHHPELLNMRRLFSSRKYLQSSITGKSSISDSLDLNIKYALSMKESKSLLLFSHHSWSSLGTIPTE